MSDCTCKEHNKLASSEHIPDYTPVGLGVTADSPPTFEGVRVVMISECDSVMYKQVTTNICVIYT